MVVEARTKMVERVEQLMEDLKQVNGGRATSSAEEDRAGRQEKVGVAAVVE